MSECLKCEVGAARGNLVFGEGDPDAGLLFIGEAPGEKEDLLGRPFVGAAGRLLDSLLADIGLSRETVYITNVLKCRPPGNRDPLRAEIDECVPCLRTQVGIVAPKVVCTLGNFATKLVLGEKRGISELHGRTFESAEWAPDAVIVPLYHPAAALHNPSLRETLFLDFRFLSSLLNPS